MTLLTGRDRISKAKNGVTVRLLLLADLHNRVEGLDAVAGGHDAVLLAGDIANFGGLEKVREILSVLEEHCPVVLGVSGNCDPSGVAELLKDRGALLDGIVVEHQNFCFAGISGTEPSVFNQDREYPNSPFLKTLQKIKSALKPSLPFVFVSHQPAFNTSVDKFAQGQHTGSRAIRTFIMETEPILAVSGHIHEAVSKDKIGRTILVNPGPFKNGLYATAEINGTCVDIQFQSL
ncbi:MAG: metallophosphoesterase family protein [Anaerohalosphaeraceae bacterium]